MDNSLKKYAYVPPYWVMLTFGVCILLCKYLIVLWDTEPGMPIVWPNDRLSRFNTICGIAIIIQSCFHWSIHRKFIMIHFLWIPIGIIRWENVSQAEYIYRWSASGKSYDIMKGQGILVALKGCPYFSPEIDALHKFLWKHPFRSFFIRFTPRNQQRYVAIFKQYYPELDFQIGYEENLKRGKPYHTEDVPK